MEHDLRLPGVPTGTLLSMLAREIRETADRVFPETAGLAASDPDGSLALELGDILVGALTMCDRLGLDAGIVVGDAVARLEARLPVGP